MRLGLGLTFWAPGRGAAGDSGVTKRSAMNRTDAAAFPFLVNEPVARRIGEISAERFQGSSNNELSRAENRSVFPRA